MQCNEWPAGSSWSCGCCAVAGSCSPGRSGCVGRPAEPRGRGTGPWPGSPGSPPCPWGSGWKAEPQNFIKKKKKTKLSKKKKKAVWQLNILTSRCSRSTCSGTGGCPWGRSRRTAGPPAPGIYSPASGAGTTAPSSGEQEEIHEGSALEYQYNINKHFWSGADLKNKVCYESFGNLHTILSCHTSAELWY